MSIALDVIKQRSLFLEGPASTGKTSFAIDRIRNLIANGVHADEILLLVPQRSYTLTYEENLDALTWQRLGKATIGGIAQRMVALFWPLVLETSGFPFDKSKDPVFLTYEVAQYFMSRLVSPLIRQGYFAELKLIRHRLYSQLLDNLNKATVNGIPLDNVQDYLRSDSGTDASRKLLFEDISNTINAYREYTIERNLLDFSLYNEVFRELFVGNEEVKQYMSRQFRHLIYDNAEEDFPLAHDIIERWIGAFDSSLIISDTDGGYRKFLAANPESASGLKNACEHHIVFDQNRNTPVRLLRLGKALTEAVQQQSFSQDELVEEGEQAFFVYSDRLHHEMVDRAMQRVVDLVEKGAKPEEIAIISPFLNDSLYFAISSRLEKAGVPYLAHKPSRTLRDASMTKTLLTLTALAHPQWGGPGPTHEAMTHMFDRVLQPLDLIRATLLSDSVFEGSGEGVRLRSFDSVSHDVRDRITFNAGVLYEGLRAWLMDYASGNELPLDHFLSRLFGEVLSQPGYGLHQDEEAGIHVATVVESARKFRQAVADVLTEEGKPVGKAYMDMVDEGVISAFYELDWSADNEAVMVTPVHTYLLRNRMYTYQIWLDVGSMSWHKRIPQPLTNPYILSKDWHVGRKWTASVEKHFEVERLERIVSGLIRRCSGCIYAYFSELSVSGQEQMGDLLMALSRTKRKYLDTSFSFNQEDV